MKLKNLSLLSLTLWATALASCGSSDNTSHSSSPVDSSASGEKKTAMVVYFSATSNTKKVAEILSDYIWSPIHELVPTDPYTAEDLNYSASDSRVSLERNDPNHLTELVDTDFEEFGDSEFIFLGAPVWWGELSWVINGFVLSNDFTGKTIIPFATASSSDFDVDDLRPLSQEAIWMDGRRFRQSEIDEESIHGWVDSLNINF